MILRWLTPSQYVAAITDLNPDDLHAAGVRGMILDLDNTIVASNAALPAPEVLQWVTHLHRTGLRACIVSNNLAGRARAMGDLLRMPVVAGAIKPVPWAFRRAMAIMGTAPGETALVGDQLFTDVLGGNLLGVRTILVDPLSVHEFPTTRAVRAVERLIRARVLRRLAKS